MQIDQTTTPNFTQESGTELDRKSEKCLREAFKSFNNGQVDSAIRRLNITFNHAFNKNWSAADTQRILNSLSWLYFYESRFDEVAFILEHAIAHSIKNYGPRWRGLSHLHYNLAETYEKLEERELSRKHFQITLRLIRQHLGVRSRSFIMLQRRFEQISERSAAQKIHIVSESDMTSVRHKMIAVRSC